MEERVGDEGKQGETLIADLLERVNKWLVEEGKAALLECIKQGMVPGDVVIIFKPNKQPCTLRQIAPHKASLGAYCGFVTKHSALYIYRELNASLVIRFQYHPDSNTVTVTDTWTSEQLTFETPRSRKRRCQLEKKQFIRLPNPKRPPEPGIPYCLMIFNAFGSFFTPWHFLSSRNAYLTSVGVLTRDPIPINEDPAGPASCPCASSQPLMTFAGEKQVRAQSLLPDWKKSSTSCRLSKKKTKRRKRNRRKRRWR
jgi:hypothetical protein